MKKVILMLLLILVVFMFFGCGQQGRMEVAGSNVSTTEKNSIENSESISVSTTYNGDKPMETTDGKTSVDDNQTVEITTDSAGQNQTTTESKMTMNSVETTEETLFVVTFKDYNGDVLKEEKVKKGSDATAPDAPAIEGFVFVKWDTYYKEVNTDIIVNAVYKEITSPTLIVDTVKAEGKEAVVRVSMSKNPGLLALLMKVNYDENNMTLKKVESGTLMDGYTFTTPKNMKSGCNIAWNIIDVPENVADGEVAVLHFELSDDTKEGNYEISVSCYDGAIDENYNVVKFNIINGYINII